MSGNLPGPHSPIFFVLSWGLAWWAAILDMTFASRKALSTTPFLPGHGFFTSGGPLAARVCDSTKISQIYQLRVCLKDLKGALQGLNPNWCLKVSGQVWMLCCSSFHTLQGFLFYTLWRIRVRSTDLPSCGRTQKKLRPGGIEVVGLDVVSHKTQLLHSFRARLFSFLTLFKPQPKIAKERRDRCHEKVSMCVHSPADKKMKLINML